MTTNAEAKELVVQITNEMFQLGMLTCTGGNVSSKSSDGETIWITPSQLYKGSLREADLVRIRDDGSTVEGARPPSVEWQMHFGCYRARPDTKGALHTHSPIATAAGIVNALPFPPINTDAVFLRDTQLVPWFMPGSKELADAVGSVREVVSRALRDLRSAGIVATSTDEVVILDATRLFDESWGSRRV